MDSSTGRAGADLGWGGENSAIVVEMVSANLGCVDRKSGREEIPLHDVRIWGFDGFSRQERMVLSVVKRKCKSWR